jgi:DNA-directed RNA polymerase III subunit RPC3
MADADAARLCEQIVHSHFGPLTAVSKPTLSVSRVILRCRQNIASILLTRGRLPLPTLIRYSGLKPRTVRASVLVLVQHNILWHTLSDEGSEVFEVNFDECLARLRFGRYVQQAEELFGEAVCQHMFVVRLLTDENIRLEKLYK